MSSPYFTRMGILKNAMEQALEEGNYVCVWTCPSCNYENEVDLEVPGFDITSDRARDWHSTSLQEIVCDECHQTFEGVITNSFGGVEFYIKDQDGSVIEIEVPEEWGFTPYDEDYADWLEFSASDDPFSEYMNSFFHIGDLIADYDNHHSREIVLRMVFVHHITALEAFLSDTLMNFIFADKGSLIRLLKTDDELKKKKFRLDQIVENQSLIENEVKAYLRTIMYHNLSRVSFLYKTTMGLDIFDCNVSRDELQKAVQLRHHCVHRNGKDEDGKPIDELNRAYIEYVSSLLKKVVEHINCFVRTQGLKSPF